MQKPIVLRLKGTNSDKAKQMILPKEKELGLYFNDDFDSAAQQAVALAKKGAESHWDSEFWAREPVVLVLKIFKNSNKIYNDKLFISH